MKTLFTVIEKATGRVVVTEGTADECAQVTGLSPSTIWKYLDGKRRSSRWEVRKVGGKFTGFDRYDVIDNKNGELVIENGTTRECAEMMGIKLSSFYVYTCRAEKGNPVERWTIKPRKKGA